LLGNKPSKKEEQVAKLNPGGKVYTSEHGQVSPNIDENTRVICQIRPSKFGKIMDVGTMKIIEGCKIGNKENGVRRKKKKED